MFFSFKGHRSTPETHKLDSLRERLSTIPGSANVSAPTLSKLLSVTTTSPSATKTQVVNSTPATSFHEKVSYTYSSLTYNLLISMKLRETMIYKWYSNSFFNTLFLGMKIA